METLDSAARLIAATLAGGALGINRDLHSKPTGVRTLALVGLGSALATMAGAEVGGGDGATRVIQGIVTGIGFLGAGVIIRPMAGARIHGLTTAAATWLTACVGVVCGIAAWPLAAIGLPLVFIVLILGGPFEKAIRERWGRQLEDD
jgi:putative Mg2+ transporter-C (MgtC) family protein